MNKRFKFGIYLKQLDIAFENERNKALSELGVTSSQLYILLYLLMNKEIRINVKDLGKKFNLKGPTITGILNRLENKGFITRTISEEDSRYKKIEITDKAIQTESALKEKAKILEEKLIENITHEEIDKLEEILIKMLSNLK